MTADELLVCDEIYGLDRMRWKVVFINPHEGRGTRHVLKAHGATHLNIEYDDLFMLRVHRDQ